MKSAHTNINGVFVDYIMSVPERSKQFILIFSSAINYNARVFTLDNFHIFASYLERLTPAIICFRFFAATNKTKRQNN